MKRLIRGEEPVIRMEGEEKEYLWKIKKGECPPEVSFDSATG